MPKPTTGYDLSPTSTSKEFLYLQVLECLQQHIRRKIWNIWPDKWILHNENATSHKKLPEKRFLTPPPPPPKNSEHPPNRIRIVSRVSFLITSRHSELCYNIEGSFGKLFPATMYVSRHDWDGKSQKASTLKVATVSQLADGMCRIGPVVRPRGKKKKEAKVIPLQAMEEHEARGVIANSYTFFTSALDGGEWSVSRPGRALPPGKGPRYPLYRRLGRPQRLEEKSSVSVGDRTPVVQSVVRQYTDWATFFKYAGWDI
jgi:hypothetical protein